MELKELSIPDSVIEGAEFVMSRAKSVSINDKSLADIVPLIHSRLKQGPGTVEEAFGSTGKLESDVNLIFFETAVNYCFWSDSPATKWGITVDGKKLAGWYSVKSCFERALSQGMPVYDPEWMRRMSPARARELFGAGPGEPEIPLVDLRANTLAETAEFLLTQYDGSGLKCLESIDFSASALTKLVVENLPSYRDGAWYGGRWVWILKRAQIFGSDLSQLTAKYPDFKMKDTENLTAFADYRIPQVLRHTGIMEYSKDLAERVDKGRLLPAGSREEVEIRMAMILVCEKLKKYAKSISSADIDLGLWLVSHDIRHDPALAPHHKTISYYY